MVFLPADNLQIDFAQEQAVPIWVPDNVPAPFQNGFFNRADTVADASLKNSAHANDSITGDQSIKAAVCNVATTFLTYIFAPSSVCRSSTRLHPLPIWAVLRSKGVTATANACSLYSRASTYESNTMAI